MSEMGRMRPRRCYSHGASSMTRHRRNSGSTKGGIRLRSGSAGHKPAFQAEPLKETESVEIISKGTVTIITPDEKLDQESEPAPAARPPEITIDGVILEEMENQDVEYDEDEDDREGWENKLDFLFSCISVSVGLGNVWRFPYLCYKNGGGAFLLIYFIAMFACGIPIFFQEVAAGQYLRTGGATIIGQFVPMFRGVGYATMTIVFFLDIYYCIIIAWTLFYLLATIINIPSLPWETCDNWWNQKGICFNAEHDNASLLTVRLNETNSPVEEYWDRRVLQITSGIDDVGGMQWELLGTLVLGWIIVYGIIWKGLHSSGKIIWFTALFPYFVMLVLFFRSITLPGAWIGIKAYITPDFSKLLHSQTWIDSATQIFFAYSIGTGALPALGSYNKFKHNCVRDTIITCFVNTGTCLFAGVITFSILGHMVHNQGEGADFDKVVNSGPGLVFITYPEVVLKLPAGSFWAITFFLMLVTIGIDSEFCIVESLVTGLVDMFPDTLRPRRRLFTTLVCIGLFLLGVPMTTQGGAYLFQLMDFYSASGITILFCCFFQTIAIGWFFGTFKFATCVEQMTGYKPNSYWTTTWGLVAPLVMFTIFLSYLVNWEPVTYGEVKYPSWAHVIGFGMSLASMLWIPGYVIYFFLTEKGTFMEKWTKGTTPDVKSKMVRAMLKNKDIINSESTVKLLGLRSNPNSFHVSVNA